VVLVLIAMWLRVNRGEPPVIAAAPSENTEPYPPAPTPPAAAAPPPRAEAPTAPPATGEAPAAPPASEDAGTEELRPSHPLTPRHVRIQRENNLIGALEGAMDVRDGAGVRHLLQQYRSEFPDDPSQSQEGYGIIAECLEHPGPESTAAGQRYYDRERGSTLRRFVARYCLGGS
jgi:hypothetical protein